MQRRKTILCGISLLLTIASVAATALLMASHMPYRTDPAQAATQDALEQRRTGKWQAVYVLGADCPCSRRVAAHLAAAPRFADIDEQVAFVGDLSAGETRLFQQGQLRVTRRTAQQARHLYGARSAPLLLFIDPSGRIRYSGGFARRNDFRDGFQEARLWNELRRNHPVAPLPAFGCALQDGPCPAFNF